MSGPNKEGFTWPLWKKWKKSRDQFTWPGTGIPGPHLIKWCYVITPFIIIMAIYWSPPGGDGGGGDRVVEEDAGQAWCTQTYSDWAESAWQRPLSLRSLIPNSSRTSTVFQERRRTLHSNGPCSAPPLLSWLHGTVAARWLVQVVVDIRGETSIQAEEGVLLASVGIR